MLFKTMALEVPLGALTDEHRRRINAGLLVVPQSESGQGQSPTFRFYSTPPGCVRLPYLFGVVTCGMWPKTPATAADFSFSAELLAYQRPVAKSAASHLRTYGTTTLALYPGFGKTVLAVYLVSVLRMRVAVLCHRRILARQWLQSFGRFSTARAVQHAGRRGAKGGGSDIAEADADVVIFVDKGANALPTADLSSFGVLVIDEAHRYCTRLRCLSLLRFAPHYVLALSATPERTDGLHRALQLVVGEHCVAEQLAAPFDVRAILTGVRPTSTNGASGRLDWVALVADLCANERRNALILDLVAGELAGRKTIILTGRIDHTIALEKAIRARLGEGSVARLSGTQGAYHDAPVLVGTLSKIGEGFDEATACMDFQGVRANTLILAVSIRGIACLVQAVGRVLRSERPLVIDLVDAHLLLGKHWRERRAWYEAHGGQVKITKVATAE